MVRIVEKTDEFAKFVKKLDHTFKEKAELQIKKILQYPEIGKPMKFDRKGTRELYIKPFRLSYEYLKQEDKIIFLSIYHKDKQ